MPLDWEGVFAGVIKSIQNLEMMVSLGQSECASKPNDKCPYKTQTEGDVKMELREKWPQAHKPRGCLQQPGGARDQDGTLPRGSRGCTDLLDQDGTLPRGSRGCTDLLIP